MAKIVKNKLFFLQNFVLSKKRFNIVLSMTKNYCTYYTSQEQILISSTSEKRSRRFRLGASI